MSRRETDRPALDPFAFPAETNVRFLLLIVAAVMLAVTVAPLLQAIYLDAIPTPQAVELPTVETPDAVYFPTAQDVLFGAVRDAGRLLNFPTLLAAGVFVLALLIYRRHPARLRRRYGLQPISDDTVLQRSIEQLSARANLPPPSVEAPPGLLTTGGAQAFGLGHRYAVRFDDARVRLRKQPALFRAVFLHELAHIANGDIGRTYFAEALWRAALILAVGAYVLGIAGRFFGSLARRLGQGTAADWGAFFSTNLPLFLFSVLQLISLLALVYAIRASILRVRELYADWRVRQWAEGEALLSLLSRRAAAEQQGRGWRHSWRLHPTARQRLATLQNPIHLFRLSPDLPFFVGVLLALVVEGWLVPVMIPSLITAGNAALGLSAALAANGNPMALAVAYILTLAAVPILILLSFLAFLLVGYLAAGTIVVQLLREGAAARSGRPASWLAYVRLWLPAALLVIGLEVGFAIAPFALLSPLGLLLAGRTALLPLQVAGSLSWLLAVLTVTWFWLLFGRFLARRLAARHNGAPPRWKQRLLVWTSSALVSLLYLPFFLSRLALYYQPDLVRAWAWLLLPVALLVPLFFIVILAGAVILVPLSL